MKRDIAIHAVATGGDIATSGTSAFIAIPNTSAGTKPYYLRIASTAAARVKLGANASVVAAAGDMLINPSGDGVILAVGGATHIAAIQVSGAGIVNVLPLEDQ